jgi:4-hydroxybenzoyl-CoA thioesterase
MKRTHIHPVDVEFGDCDPAGIVYFPNFFRWVDASSRQFFAACGVPPWRELSQTVGIIGTPLVSTSANFMLPATYGEKIAVHTTVVEWKNKSFVMEHVIRRGDDTLCSIREVRVFAGRHPDDPSRMKAVVVPEDIMRLCTHGQD